MKPNAPPAKYAFAYKDVPYSGNKINGLGSTEKFRPVPPFHNTGRGVGREEIPWAALDTFFNMSNPWTVFWENIKGLWERRNAAGPVTRDPIEVTDPKAMADQIKTKAKELGIDLVGITLYDDDSQYREHAFPYKYAIMIGTVMNRDAMVQAPHTPAAKEVMRGYLVGSKRANKLAAYIRSLGWQAEGYGIGEDLVQHPMAIASGIGTLGKHGSLISREYGSNFRISSVLTDLPMALDKPVDFGAEDFCISCKKCVIECPPSAIFDTKQMVRGVEKWYVDFDKCIYYFSDHMGCSICIEVCPWSEPGTGPSLSEKMLKRREAAVNS
ncbi:MAG: 4Fe-4S dicluster domain-containing protein [Rhizobiales bacterium]|nr:4Fe-4S dicluster domain-containing protein [Hyphomicrobiales bacterium]